MRPHFTASSIVMLQTSPEQCSGLSNGSTNAALFTEVRSCMILSLIQSIPNPTPRTSPYPLRRLSNPKSYASHYRFLDQDCRLWSQYTRRVGEGTFLSFLYVVPDDDRVLFGCFVLAFRFMKFDMRMLVSFALSRSQEIFDEGNAVLLYGDGGENLSTSPKFKTKD